MKEKEGNIGSTPIKRIEDEVSQRVTFSKRRPGLMKKARELSVLCDDDLAVVVFSGTGRLYEFANGDRGKTEEDGKVPMGVCETEGGVANDLLCALRYSQKATGGTICRPTKCA